MLETQRESVPSNDDGELDTALGAGGLDTLTAVPVGDAPRTLRWVLAHMTSETARHAGHADILRELIDGTTGR